MSDYMTHMTFTFFTSDYKEKWHIFSIKNEFLDFIAGPVYKFSRTQWLFDEIS
jgi:hypothetical protein